MKDLEARRKALAAEAEVYRQTLKLELQNLRLYSRQMGGKFTAFRPMNPLLGLAAPFLAAALGRRRRKRLGFLSTAMICFQLFTRVAPMIPGLVAMFKGRRTSRKSFRPGSETPASSI